MPILLERMRWTAVAEPFSPCGVKSWKSTSPRMHPVRFLSANGDRPPGFSWVYRILPPGAGNLKIS
jgi:hypothetical protein